MPWYELADKQTVNENPDGTRTVSKIYRINGEPTANPPEGAGGLPERGEAHPAYADIKVQARAFRPVPAAGWDCELTYAANEIEIFQQTPTNIGQYRYGLTHSETVVQMPVGRKTFKWLDQGDRPPISVNFFEVVGLEIPTGAMTFTVETVEWAPAWADIQAIRTQRGKIHQFGGPSGPLFRFMGGETQYLGQRGVGSDPRFRNVVRYHYRWTNDDGTKIADSRSGDLVTPTENGNVLNRDPFTQWMVLPSATNSAPPGFTLLRPYDQSDLRGWRSLPGAQYWVDIE